MKRLAGKPFVLLGINSDASRGSELPLVFSEISPRTYRNTRTSESSNSCLAVLRATNRNENISVWTGCNSSSGVILVMDRGSRPIERVYSGVEIRLPTGLILILREKSL